MPEVKTVLPLEFCRGELCNIHGAWVGGDVRPWQGTSMCLVQAYRQECVVAACLCLVTHPVDEDAVGGDNAAC